MMNVWYTIPAARPALEANVALEKWKAQGYKIALWLDPGVDPQAYCCDNFIEAEYPGYAQAVNHLIRKVLAMDLECDWVVTGGDDVWPDPDKRAEEIAEECTKYFWDRAQTSFEITFGVMQPTGDRFGDDPWSRHKWPDAPAYIDRICGSPFMGRDFCRRANNGIGPLHPHFFHMHVDECLLEYAKMLGILWQRRDLTHHHDHWGRTGDSSKMPDFLRTVNSPEHWEESKAILDRLKEEKFASCLPLP